MPRLLLTALVAASLVCSISCAETSCSAGTYVENNVCMLCASGTFAVSGGMSNCTMCPAGEYQDTKGQTACKTCPAGRYASAKGSRSCSNCSAGSYSEGGVSECSPCAAGKFQPFEEQSFCKSCATGYYSTTPGATVCTQCGSGDSHFTTVLGDATSFDDCACQTYYSGNNCDVVDTVACGDALPGFFSFGAMLLLGSEELQTKEQARLDYEAAGYAYYENADMLDSISTALTSLLKSHDANGNGVLTRAEMIAAVSSLHINVNTSNMLIPTWSTPLPCPTDAEEYYLIVGGDLSGSNITVNKVTISSLRWSGNDNCGDDDDCITSTVSIASAWFADGSSYTVSACIGKAPLVLRFAAPAGVRRVLIEHESSAQYIDVVLATDADGAAAVWASYAADYSWTWATTPATTRTNEHFLVDYIREVSSVSIDAMAEQAMLSYRQSGTFDFTGMNHVTSLTADSIIGETLSDDECNTQHNKDIFVTLIYSSESDRAGTSRLGQCAFVNGETDRTTFETTYGSILVTKDSQTIADYNNRRVYCVLPMLCDSATSCDSDSHIAPGLAMAQCTVGIRYDGSPLDVRPLLTMSGVEFSMVDTAVGEIRFDIYRSDHTSGKGNGTVERDGAFVLGVPYGSRQCGRTFQPLEYVDSKAASYPGNVFEYGVQALWDAQGTTRSKMSVAQYRVPWLAEVDISAEDEFGDKVAGVAFSVCKLDGDSNVDSEYCPLVAGETDAYGTFIAEIRVADSKWRRQVQHFRVRPSKITWFEDDSYVNHTFAPAYLDITLSHMTTSGLMFSDQTFSSVSGVVAFNVPDSNTNPGRWNTDTCSR